MRFGVILVFLAGLTSAACGDRHRDSDSGNTFDSPKAFFSTATSLTVEVAYEAAAEPFVGDLPKAVGGPLWNVVSDNIKEVFKNRPVAAHVTVPVTLQEMTEIAPQGGGPYSTQEILAIAGRYRKQQSTANSAAIFVVFLDGYLETNGAPDHGVIGVTLGGSTIIAIFKPVITSSGRSNIERFVEQSTLVHEIGHAVGLVDKGIPQIANHQDDEHKHHCSNDRCVMFWANEGLADLKKFLADYTAHPENGLVMFKPDCLTDAQGFHP